jgi:hypothetical protein
MRLTEALSNFIAHRRINNVNGTCTDILQFFRPAKGEAKRVCRFLDSNPRDLMDMRPATTFINLTGINLGYNRLNNQYGSWNWSFLPNRFRDFLFKFFNNQLPINTRLSHFVPNINRSCTFCVIRRVPVPEDESFLHVFYVCHHVSHVHQWFLHTYFQGLQLTNAEHKNLFLQDPPAPPSNLTPFYLSQY